MKCLDELEKSQWWSRSELLELQNQRLTQLIKYTYDNVPYYRRIFDERALKPSDIQDSEDLVKLPVLTKPLIRTHFDELKARHFPAKEAVRLTTGGSTGEPLVFYRTRHDQIDRGYAALQRAWGWAGYQMGDKVARLAVRRPYKSTMHKFSQISKSLFLRTLLLNAAEVSVKTLPFFYQMLEEFSPKFLQGYPSALYLLARFIEREGKPKFQPQAIIARSEQLYDYQRELFTKVFQCETYSSYSSWEVRAIAAECSEHLGHHIAAENIVVEIVDDRGELVPLGREGRITITNLHNHAMPFIKYDIGDVGVASDIVCPCGRGLPMLAKLSGRTTDVIFTKSGRIVVGTALNHVFHNAPGVEQYQLLQENYEGVLVKLVVNKECPKEHLDELSGRIIDQYRRLLGEEMAGR